MPTQLFAFTDTIPGPSDRAALLGGKGAGLVEMSQALRLPVPPGFIIPTSVCLEYLASGWPAGLDEAITEQLARLGDQLGRRLGDAAAPLLVSVRSGAPVSMPGMMDTVLNVGMTGAVREALAAATGNPRFAADTWSRFLRMYATTVLNVQSAAFAPPPSRTADAIELLADGDFTLRAATSAGVAIPLDPTAQVRGAVEAVFRSWHSERARAYRARERISEELGTAVVIQAMVFGNLDDRSGSGVVFTRDPSTGENVPFGDYLARAQGEDVVAGTHAVHGLGLLRDQLPEVDAQLRAILGRLEHHYRDMCDVEFTVSEGRLFILQTRVGKRSPLAAVRIAVDMAEDPDFPLTVDEAIARVGAETVRQAAAGITVAAGSMPAGEGLAASPGVGCGVLCCDPGRAYELSQAGTPVVLVRRETSPEDVHGMMGAAAIVTTLGGVASHAAVVARGWNIPAITSLRDAEVSDAGLTLPDGFMAEGELVTVDGGAGRLYRGDCRGEGASDSPQLRTFRRWLAESGGASAAQSAGATSAVAVDLYTVGRVIQLKGLCGPERAAAILGVATEAVEAVIEANAASFKATPRGLALTPEARAWVLAQVVVERDTGDQAALQPCYAQFTALDRRFKQLVTAWQTSDPAAPERHPGAATALAGLHDALQPVLAAAAAAFPRLASYPVRLAAALAAFAAGDGTMLASPLKDSYHTVWFEYHEELIALSGRDRATEEAAGH